MENTDKLQTTQINLRKNSLRQAPKVTKIYPKSLFVATLLFVMVIIETRYSSSYIDEIIGVISVVLVIGSVRRITNRDAGTLILLGISIGLGLLSNYLYEINPSIFSVFVDVLTQIKIPFAVFAVKYNLTEKEKLETINLLTPLARIFIIAAFVCAILTLFFETGMTDVGGRFGLPTFKFIFPMNHYYTSCAFMFFGVIVCSQRISQHKKHFYYVIGLIAILLSLKAPGIIFTVSFIVYIFYFKRYQNLSLKVFIPLLLVLLLLSRYQISTYILNTTSPRRMFIDKSFVTANNYFPLGSGFGTYGSAEAMKHYSKLYYEYRFNERWGMTPDYGPFLLDTYWPTILGQFGYFGFFVFVLFYARFFLMLKESKSNYEQKALIYAVFLQYIVHALGSAILSSSQGMIGFMALALFAVPDYERENRKLKAKIKIRF